MAKCNKKSTVEHNMIISLRPSDNLQAKTHLNVENEVYHYDRKCNLPSLWTKCYFRLSIYKFILTNIALHYTDVILG